MEGAEVTRQVTCFMLVRVGDLSIEDEDGAAEGSLIELIL